MSSYIIQLNARAHIKGDREAIVPALSALYKKNGVLTKELIVKAAKPKSSPLHGEFEWDDAVAADGYRKIRAGYLITHIEITVQRTKKSAPVTHHMYVPVYDDEKTFLSVPDLMSDPDRRQLYYEKLLTRLNSMIDELNRFEEFFDVVSAIKKL